jgi:hypothetical protein
MVDLGDGGRFEGTQNQFCQFPEKTKTKTGGRELPQLSAADFVFGRVSF